MIDAAAYPQSIVMIPKLKVNNKEANISAFLIISTLKVILDFPHAFNALIFSVYNGVNSDARHKS